MGDLVGWGVAHVDEDGDVIELLGAPIVDNHVPLLEHTEAVALRGDRDQEWWRLVTVHIEQEEAS